MQSLMTKEIVLNTLLMALWRFNPQNPVLVTLTRHDVDNAKTI